MRQNQPKQLMSISDDRRRWVHELAIPPDNTRNALQPPSGMPGTPAASVQLRRDPAQRATARSQLLDCRQHRLLLPIRLQVLAVGPEPEAIRDVSHALAVRLLVVHGVACSLADGLFPIEKLPYIMSIASLPAPRPVSSDSATETSDTP